ncbi:MAG: hypothetical protein VX900_16825 [Pseudomonadota bacterium]|nr:hypothetical protein [Pseudomonadota bacterium]
MPGLVDIHAHPATEIFYCDLREDHSAPEHYITGLCERFCYPGWLDVMARSGMRKFTAPTFETSRWYRDNVHQYKFEEDISKGEQAFAHALDVIEIARNHLSGRLDGVVAPSTIDKGLLDILSKSRAEASKRGFAWTTHVSSGARVQCYDRTLWPGRRYNSWLSTIFWMKALSWGTRLHQVVVTGPAGTAGMISKFSATAGPAWRTVQPRLCAMGQVWKFTVITSTWGW